jgi:caffeoyl-CoA O-methyltransferase
MDPDTTGKPVAHEKFTALTPALYAYLVEHNHEPDAVLRDLAAETLALGEEGSWQCAIEEGALLTMLARLVSAKRAVEVGTFTGYGAISIARGLAPGGELLSCEFEEKYASIARRYIARAGLADVVTLRVAPALDTLRALPLAESIDLAFIDADKKNYRHYYDELLPRMRPNGLIVIDNVLWRQRVIDPDDSHKSTRVIRALNDFLVRDERVDIVMLGVADGITLVRKRPVVESPIRTSS